MFLEKLTRVLNDAFRPRPQYITVTPVTGRPAAPVLPPAGAREILEAVLGIRIGDDLIGQAVERYEEKMTMVRGW